MLLPLCGLPCPTDPAGLPAGRIEPIVNRVLTTPVAVTPTGMYRAGYLNLMQRIIRVAATWQDDQGAMVDPVQKVETGQTSPRFVSSGAVLLHFGRVPELREQIYRGMDYCCQRLAGGEAQSPDFWMRELMTAWMLLEAEAPAERRDRWAEQIRSIDPEKINWYVEKPDKPIETLHNWTVYAAAGEGLRELCGLAHPDSSVKSGRRFWDKYMPAQLAHFTNDGMYRDPGDPITYDMTTRLQFATPLAFGLTTPIDGRLHELLRRGALAELLYASPDGLAPFGGRSAALNFQECIFAAIGELEARRYRESNPRLAGAFKRHARLGVKNILRWFEMEPHRHIKNGFPPEAMHGCEPYAGYAVYSCFAASCLGLAALFADESIEESATPAEIGGYVVEFSPAFHKVIASAGSTQIEIDTAADPKYDATGLGRFTAAGVPIELGLGMPFPATPNFNLPAELKPKAPLAIGPGWKVGDQWVSLAGLGVGLTSTLTIEDESPAGVRFHIEYRHGEAVVRESYKLIDCWLTVAVSVQVAGRLAERIRMTVPMLQSNGRWTVEWPDYDWPSFPAAYVIYEPFRGGGARQDEPIANRHGIYVPQVFEREGGEIKVQLRFVSASEMKN